MKPTKINALTQAQLILAMLDGTLNCQELAEVTGLHYVTVLQHTRALHAAGAAHICAWETDTRGRECVKIYKIGKGKDKPKVKLTPAQRTKRYREKKAARQNPLLQLGAA